MALSFSKRTVTVATIPEVDTLRRRSISFREKGWEKGCREHVKKLNLDPLSIM
jgi:hypothetical protein